jgi:hypothetical protein
LSLLTIQCNRDVRFTLCLSSSCLACLNLISRFSSQTMVTDKHSLTMSSWEKVSWNVI